MPKIEISFQKMEKDAQIKEYFIKKIHKFERLLEKATEIKCTVTEKENRNYAKVTITIALPNAVVRIKVRQPDSRSAIDEAVDSLGIRLKKYRDKMNRRKRKRRISWQSLFRRRVEQDG